MNYQKIVIVSGDVSLEVTPLANGESVLFNISAIVADNEMEMVIETKDIIALIKALQKYTEPF